MWEFPVCFPECLDSLLRLAWRASTGRKCSLCASGVRQTDLCPLATCCGSKHGAPLVSQFSRSLRPRRSGLLTGIWFQSGLSPTPARGPQPQWPSPLPFPSLPTPGSHSCPVLCVFSGSGHRTVTRRDLGVWLVSAREVSGGIAGRVPWSALGLAASSCRILAQVIHASGPSHLGAKGFPLDGGAGWFCLLLSDVWAVSSLGISRSAS